MKNNELYHHGRLGQRWGKKNGPPYPLDYSQLSQAERERAKSRAKREGNLKEAADNKIYYSDQELRDVVNRFKLNREVSELLTPDNVSKGMKTVDNLTKKLNTVEKLGNAVVKTTTTGINLYNRLGVINARYSGTEFEAINFAGNKKKDGDKKKDN